MSLPIKKIYIDSRFKSADSKSDSEFFVDLPQTLLMPERAGFYLDDISIPVSWYPIEAGRNNKLYIELFEPPMEFSTTRITLTKVVEIPEQNYTTATLGTMIQTKINDAFATHNFTVTVTSDQATQRYSILCNETREWKLLTDAEIAKKGGYSTPYCSMNYVLANFTPQNLKNKAPDKLPNPDPVESIKVIPFVSGYINVFPIRNIYIVASGIGNFNTMSLSGERAIVKKVPVTAGYGEMIFNDAVVGMDYLDCSRQTLSRLGFRLTNLYGETIDLHGHHWSFSLVFSKIQEIT